MSSSRTTKIYSRQSQVLEKSTSLPAIPSAAATVALLPLLPVPTTPTRNQDDTTNDHNKQLFDSTEHDRGLNKARTMSALESSLIAARFPPPSTKDGVNPSLPTTPKRNLPTLTELLASSRKGKQKLHSPKRLKPKLAVRVSVDLRTNKKSKFCFPSPLPLLPAILEDNFFMLDPEIHCLPSPSLHLLDLTPKMKMTNQNIKV